MSNRIRMGIFGVIFLLAMGAASPPNFSSQAQAQNTCEEERDICNETVDEDLIEWGWNVLDGVQCPNEYGLCQPPSQDCLDIIESAYDSVELAERIYTGMYCECSYQYCMHYIDEWGLLACRNEALAWYQQTVEEIGDSLGLALAEGGCCCANPFWQPDPGTDPELTLQILRAFEDAGVTNNYSPRGPEPEGVPDGNKGSDEPCVGC